MFELISYISQYIFLFVLHVARGDSFPKPLKKAEEQHYLELAAHGDISARNILVEHNLRLVAHIIKKYYQNCGGQEDLVSIGTIGLIKAINTYDPSKNIKLSSYASRCIENEILMHFRGNRKSALNISLNDAIDTDKDGNPLTLMDILASDMDVAEDVDTKLKLEMLGRYIDEELTDREKTIIENRYGIGGRRVMTQREIAQGMNISRSYISRIEKKALEKLRKRYEKS